MQGNLIGTDVTGTVAIGNGALPSSAGVRFSNFAGGYIGTDGNGPQDDNEGNVISGNLGHGIRLQGGGGSFGDHVVAGNLIGVDISGTVALGNADFGISILSSTGNRIGTDANDLSDSLEANVIAGNQNAGIDVLDSTATGLCS